jgi:hypothetical protein
MLLKIGKMTPQCPKRLTSESQLPDVEYTGFFFCKAVLTLVQSTQRSQFPGVFITGESELHGVFKAGGGEVETPLSGQLTGEKKLRDRQWLPDFCCKTPLI